MLSQRKNNEGGLAQARLGSGLARVCLPASRLSALKSSAVVRLDLVSSHKLSRSADLTQAISRLNTNSNRQAHAQLVCCACLIPIIVSILNTIVI